MAAESYRYDFLLPDLVKIITYPKEDKYKHPGYRDACDHADQMAVHLYGDLPTKLLNRVRPREDPAITQYRLESYEPTTESTAGKALSITNKIFNPNLSAIKPAEGEQGQELFEYVTEKYPVFNSIMAYLSEYALKKVMADPNGVFLVEPGNMVYGEQIDLTKQIAPVVTCYPSKDVYLITPEYVVVFLKMEEDQESKEYYFKYIDKQIVTEFYLKTTNTRDYFTVHVGDYVHDCGTIPAWQLGGAYDQRNSKLFKSFFYPAVPFWNKAISAESDLDGAFISHLHPQKWEVADECEFVQNTDHGDYACSGGHIYDPQKKGGRYTCPGCNGTGRKSVKGPYSTYQVSRDKLIDPSGASLNQPPAGYIDVPTRATEMLDERVDKLLEKGLSALAMDIVNKIGENQSGVAKAYDRTELFDFLGKVRDLFYDKHLKNIVYYFAKYMFIGKSDEQIAAIEPTIIKPNSFDVLTTQELAEQVKVAKEATVNPAYIQLKQIEVQNKEFQSHPQALQLLNLIVSLDPFAEVSRTDIDLMIYSGTASKKSVIIHDNIRDLVRRALEEDKAFPDKLYEEQMEVLQAYADEIMDEISEETKVEIDLSAIEPPPDDTAGAGK